jgi:ComF family protein
MALVHRLRSEGARWVGRGIDLLFPPRCGLCHEDIPCVDAFRDASGGMEHGRWCGFCEACALALSSDVRRCMRCAEAAAGPFECRRCRNVRRDRDGLVVLAGYGDRLRDAVLRAKRPAGEGIARGLATLLFHRHEELLCGWGIDTVVPVPMHWLRRAVRGTSAAEELARRVAALLGVPSRAVLLRQRATRMQNELPVHERRGNVRDAFRPRHRVDGRRILLVDDVVTTGSTLAACRRTLVAAGAAAVFAAVVAKADRSSDGGDA